MMQRTAQRLYRTPKNYHLAPQHDKWFERHDAWTHLKRMSKLAGTGYYIPPAWYQHFRMFPPIGDNFNEATTQNPHDSAEPTQLSGTKLHDDLDQRAAVRLELAKRSRSAAASGNRYLNQFWVQKPLDEMEREYYRLTKKLRISHAEAIRRVLTKYHEGQARQARIHTIQAEEAKLTGKFITMREAMSVINLLNQVQSTSGIATHQYAEIATETARQFAEDPMMEASVVQRQVPRAAPAVPDETASSSKQGDSAQKPETAEGDAAASVASTIGVEPAYDIVDDVVATPTAGDTLPKLRESMHDGMDPDDVESGLFWYDGDSPSVDAPSSSTSGGKP